METDLIAMEKRMQMALELLYEIRNDAKKENMLHSQLYIDFEDKVNKFSVLDPLQ